MRPVVMTVAGSDSGGGAGIQADLRAIGANGGFGTTVLTAVTAQNLEGVRDVHGMPVDHVRAQLAAVMGGFPVAAAKTGMLWSGETIAVVVRAVERSRFPWVVDPVMVASSGAKLLQDDAIERYRTELIPLAALVTPNLDEAAVLMGRTRIADDEHEDVALHLAREHRVPFLVKGGHREGALVDVLALDGQLHRFPATRRSLNTHGSGCSLSAAIATRLATGDGVREAVEAGLAYLAAAAAKPHQISEDTRLLGLE